MQSIAELAWMTGPQQANMCPHKDVKDNLFLRVMVLNIARPHTLPCPAGPSVRHLSRICRGMRRHDRQELLDGDVQVTVLKKR